jgi:nicotinamidase-related amidase
MIDNPDRELYRTRGIGDRIHGGDRPGLLVVDLSRAFTEPGYRCSCANDEATGNVVRLLEAFRREDRPIVFTAIEYATPEALEGGWFSRKMPALTELVAGSPACELDPRLERRPHEPLIMKKYTSSFFGTCLVPTLVSSGVDTLVIVGASTSGCVRATVVDAVQFGFRVLVPGDAVADRARGPHEAALFDIDGKYGDVMTTDDVLAYLAATSSRTGV